MFGPQTSRKRRSDLKRCCVLFTCFASRAVHIEVANALDTDSFTQALRRFIARRRPVRLIRSDNDTHDKDVLTTKMETKSTNRQGILVTLEK